MAVWMQAAVLFDKFHIMRNLGEALDKVRNSEYARVASNKRLNTHLLKGSMGKLWMDGRGASSRTGGSV